MVQAPIAPAGISAGTSKLISDVVSKETITEKVEKTAQETTDSTLETLVNEINRFEAVIQQWDGSQQAVVTGLKQAIEALHKTALTRLICSLKQDAAAALRQAVEDEVVYGVLRYHDLVKAPQPPLMQRLESAIAEVRPSLTSHQGDVELVAVRLPDTVEVRFIGACSHCPASALTLSQGVEQAIKRYCPEIVHVIAVNTVVVADSGKPTIEPDARWRLVTSLAEIPEGGVLSVKLEGKSLLLSRWNDHVVCYDNACRHLGMAIDQGTVDQGVLTCPHHGFQYELATGHCRTAPDLSLLPYPVEVRNGQVLVQVWD